MFGDFERAIELEPAGLEPLEQKIKRHDFGQRSGMAQSVRAGGLQYRSAIAINNDGRKRRRIIFDAGVTVPVTGMGMMLAGMMVPSRVGDVASDGKGRSHRGTRQQAVTKPETSFEFHRGHW